MNSLSLFARVRATIVGTTAVADRGPSGGLDAFHEPIGTQHRLEDCEGLDLTAWDAQVRIQIDANRRLAASAGPLSSERDVLDELAALTARYRYMDNGSWRAAMTLFGGARFDRQRQERG